MAILVLYRCSSQLTVNDSSSTDAGGVQLYSHSLKFIVRKPARSTQALI
jgi:hypothetical protein